MSGMRARNLIPTGSKISQRKNLFFILQRYVSVETCSDGLSISDSSDNEALPGCLMTSKGQTRDILLAVTPAQSFSRYLGVTSSLCKRFHPMSGNFSLK